MTFSEFMVLNIVASWLLVAFVSAAVLVLVNPTWDDMSMTKSLFPVVYVVPTYYAKSTVVVTAAWEGHALTQTLLEKSTLLRDTVAV